MKKIKNVVLKFMKWKNKLASKLVPLTLSHFFVIAPIVSISAADSSSSVASYNQKYKIVATNDDNVDSSTEFRASTNSSVYVIKSFSTSWQKQIDLLQNISLTNSNQIFKVTIDQVKNSHNFKDRAFTIEDIKTKAADENFEPKPIIRYLKLDKATKNAQIAKEFVLVNKAGKKFGARLKWVIKNNKWNLELLYKQQANGPGEDDSIYRYKGKLISNPKIIEEVNKADELVSLINSKITKDSGMVSLSKTNEDVQSAKSMIKNAQSFKEYSGIDLTKIANIDNAIFSSEVNDNAIDITILIPNSTARKKITYKITSFSIMKIDNVDSTIFKNGFMYQTSGGSIYVGTNNQGLKKLVIEDNSYSLETVVPTNVSKGFMYQTDDGVIYVGTNNQGLKKLVIEGGSYSLETVDDINVQSGFMYQTKTKDKSIYVGTYENGLKKLVKNDDDDSYSLETVYDIDVGTGFMCQTEEDGAIYVGTYDQGLKKLVIEDGSYSLETVYDIDVSTGFMYQTADDTIYVGTWDKGLKKLVENDDDSYSLETVDDTSVRYGFMYQTADGAIYVGTYDQGLKKLVIEDDSYSLETVDDIDVRQGFMYQTKTKDKSIYVGTYENGLKKLVKEIKNLSLITFESKGSQGSGTLAIKKGITIPDQVKITYAKKVEESKEPLPNQYSDDAPKTLSNGDKIYIKFAIKNNYQATHVLSSDFKNPIVFTAIGLNQMESRKSEKAKKQAKKTKLSTGAIVGIVIGSIVALGIIAGFLGVKFGKFKKIKFRK